MGSYRSVDRRRGSNLAELAISLSLGGSIVYLVIRGVKVYPVPATDESQYS